MAAPLIHWRTAFWLFGLLGLVWCLGFALWFRNWPEEKPSVNAAELAGIRRGTARPEAAAAGIPWARILSSRNLWAVCAMYGLQSFGWYFYITYLPRFLEEQFAVPSNSLFGHRVQRRALVDGSHGVPDRRLADRPVHPQDGKPPLGPPHPRRRGAFADRHLLLAVPGGPHGYLVLRGDFVRRLSTDLAMGSAWAICRTSANAMPPSWPA